MSKKVYFIFNKSDGFFNAVDKDLITNIEAIEESNAKSAVTWAKENQSFSSDSSEDFWTLTNRLKALNDGIDDNPKG